MGFTVSLWILCVKCWWITDFLVYMCQSFLFIIRDCGFATSGLLLATMSTSKLSLQKAEESSSAAEMNYKRGLGSKSHQMYT